MFDVDAGDSLTTFTLLRPTGGPDAYVTRFDGAAAAGQPVVTLVLEVRWADG